jgi:hypothetical protein
MGRLATRLQRLEALVPTAPFVAAWLRILREAAQVTALDDDTAEALLAAIEARHQALQIPGCVEATDFPAVAHGVLDAALAEIAACVPAAQKYALRKAASDLCWAEARRHGYPAEEQRDGNTIED